MQKPKKTNLRHQVEALEALAGLKTLSESESRRVNGGRGTAASGTGTASPTRPIKPNRGSGGVAVRNGSGAVAVFRGSGAVAVRIGPGA